MKHRIIRYPSLSRPDHLDLLLVLLGVLGTVLILLRLQHGVGVNGDAKYYIEVARALAEGERGIQWLMGQIPQLLWKDYLLWETEPFTFRLDHSAQWPPLYSVLLAIFGGFVFDARDVAGPLNAVAFGLTIFFAGQWLRSAVRSQLLVMLGCSAILFSVGVTWIASWAYSESIFILFVILALFHSSRSLKSWDRSSLIWAAVFTALACLTRYTGIALMLIMVALLILRSGPVYLGKLKHIGLYLAISATPLAFWLFRNYLVTESLTGPARGSERSVPFVKQVGRGLSSIEAWNPLMVDLRSLLLPIDILTGRVIGVLEAGAILFALFTFVLWGTLRWWRDRAGNHRLACLAVAGSYAFCHIIFTNVNAALGNVILEARHIIPAYIPLVVVTIIGTDFLVNNQRWISVPAVGSSRGKLSFSTIAIVSLVICISYTGIVSVRDTHRAVFNPEYGWYAYVYNAEHISIETPSLTNYLYDRVGDSPPIVRGHFDLYIADRALIYFREECSSEDFAQKISLRVVPANGLSLSGIRKNFGMDILSFYPARQGAMRNGECLAVAPLPKYDIDMIVTGQRGDGGAFWEVEIRP